VLVAAHVVLLLVLAFAGTDPAGPNPPTQRGGDFLPCWAGGTLIAEGRGHELYDRRAFGEIQERVLHQRVKYPSGYPPPVYQACALTTSLSYGNAARVAVLGNPVLFAIGAGLLLLCVPGLRSEQRAVGLGVAFVSPAFLMNSITGQNLGVWLLLLGGGLLLWRRGRPVLAGAVLGLLCVKPSLAGPVALALVLSGQLRTLVGFALGGATLVGVSAVIAGTPQLWLDWGRLIAAGRLDDMMWSVPHRHFSMRALWVLPAHGTALEASAGWAARAAGLGLAASFAPLAWRASPEDDPSTRGFLAVVAACLFASPHLIEYDLAVYLPAFAAGALLLVGDRARRPRLGAALTLAVYVAPLSWPLSKALGFSVGSGVMLLWLLWLRSELGAQRAGS
jgi:hypothetical protein